MWKTYKFWVWLLCFSMIVSAISAPAYIGATEVKMEGIEAETEAFTSEGSELETAEVIE